jgi:hypothetical protein
LFSHPITPHKTLDNIVIRLRRRWLLQKLSCTFLLVLCAGQATYWMTEWIVLPIIAVAATTALAALLFSQSKQYQNITANKVLLHLNRQFSECEESAELILLPSSGLTTLQQLQKNRVQPKVESLLSTDLSSRLPRYSSQPATLLSAAVVLIFILIKLIPADFISQVKPANTELVNQAPKPTIPISLVTKIITVTAPSYTGLVARQTTELNLELIAGSTVTWRLQFSGLTQQNDLSILLPDKQRIALIQQADDYYLATTVVSQSGVYHLAADEKILGGIHTIAVTADTRPTIRFVEPTQTITELAKDSKPRLQAIVSIDDDFGLSQVEILASIASGSGEAVKFRDQTFQFDSHSSVEGKTLFVKNWDLTELNMQPGDELYFSIRAWDNRQPIAQQSRSASKIIRWLEDEQQAVLADGALIDFIPEYFKSQRQIIIETKELIADKNNLSKDKIDHISQELGAAQSFLKQKYGQFLGDEFDSGTPQAMEAGPELEHDEHDEDDKHADDAEKPASEHEHEDSEHSSEGNDKSGYSTVISQFGHAHGEADDGNFIKNGTPNPKRLMKRAIANMWQAELHLLLSQPELALPFENQALELLNRAKKAERIYVKRLGFAPPPVSEKRRYQGDLTDILSYQRNETTPKKNTAKQSALALLTILNQHLDKSLNNTLTIEQTSILEKVKTYFSEQLSVTPKDITFIATLEKIQLADSFNLTNCEDCISELRKKLWQILPPPIAAPTTRQTSYSLQNKMLQKYQAFLQQQKKDAQP